MNSLAPLPVAVPLVGAVVILALNTVLSRRVVQTIAMIAALGEVGLAAVLVHQTSAGALVYWFGGWTPHAGVALGVSFTIDQLGAGAAALVGIIIAAAISTTRSTIDDGFGVAHALLLTLLAAMAGFCLTGDLFDLFVFFELMAVSAFALAAYHTGSRTALRSALNFAITNTVGAFLVLIGIALLYSRTGALNLAQIGEQLTGHADRVEIIALALLVGGFLIKAAVVPFHFWLIDTVSSAPIPLAIVLAGALDTLGIYAIARIYWTVFATSLGGQDHAVQTLLISVGAATAAIAAVLALIEEAPRRRLAFVMVAHTGILLVGVGCLSGQGVAAAATYALGDGTVKAALWIGLGLLGAARSAEDERARRAGVALLTAAGLATAGLPLFATGLGKSAIEDAAAAAGYAWVTPIIVLAAVLTGAAILHLAWGSTVDSAREDGSWLTGLGVGAVLLGISVAAVLMGHWAGKAGAQFVDTAAYQHRVLNAAAPSSPIRSSALHLSAGGAILELFAVGAAILLAAALQRDASHRIYRRVLASPVHAAVRRLHDGSIADSTTWATAGTAGIAVVFALSLR
jgi:multicomponent Na+:H+ antiporter subunit D